MPHDIGVGLGHDRRSAIRCSLSPSALMFLSDLPSPIAAFVSAARSKDGGTILSALHSVDVIVDGRREHRGTEIGAWGERLGAGSFVLRPVGARRRQDDIVVTLWVELDGERRPTESLVDFHFRMDAG